MMFRDIAAFRRFLAEKVPDRLAAGKAKGLAAGAKLVADEMRSEIGTYQSGDAGFEDWAPLAKSTLEGWDAFGGRLEGKTERRMAPPDNPLLATGALRKSIGFTVDGDEAVAGSTDPVAVWQDQGTARRGVPFVKGETQEPGIPQREFVARAGFRKAPEVVDAIGAAVIGSLTKA
jgi:phage gpG-like protein